MGHSPESRKTNDSFDTKTIFILVATLIFFVRTSMDVFILTVSCREWMKKKCLNPTDKILALQGAVRMCLGFMAMLWVSLLKFCSRTVQTGYAVKVLACTFSYFFFWNIWLTASLCGYYCVKIADFRHPFFIHLKLRLSSKVVSIWLLGSSILCFACSLPIAFRDSKTEEDGNFSNFLQNKVLTDQDTLTMVRMNHAFLAFGYSAAFSICAISVALLLFSLWRHRQRMLGTWGSHGSPQADAHFEQ